MTAASRPTLDPRFLTTPIAHRGLHDRAAGVIENSRAAAAAAVDAGYGVEIDLQLSADGEAMVFHDDELMRLTGRSGPVSARTAAELGAIPLAGSAPEETIPTLAEILAIVAGRAPLLIEAKDQSRRLEAVEGRLERRAAELLAGYEGPVAVMSFNPASVARFRDAAPAVPRGRTTDAFTAEDWPGAAPERLAALARIDDLDALGASFISHDHKDLDAARKVKAIPMPVLCWTIRSPEAERAARRIADNVTFEGYRA